MTMRLAIGAGVAVLGLVLAAPAHAQKQGPASGGMTTTAVGGTGTGGGGGSASGGHSLPSFARTRYANSAAHGSDADFQLTSFVPYEQAVKMGETARPAPETKTLGQIAAEYRAAKQRHE